MPIDPTRPMSFLSTVRRDAFGYGGGPSRVRAIDKLFKEVASWTSLQFRDFTEG
jgi:hypothetical protein